MSNFSTLTPTPSGLAPRLVKKNKIERINEENYFLVVLVRIEKFQFITIQLENM